MHTPKNTYNLILNGILSFTKEFLQEEDIPSPAKFSFSREML